MRRHPLASYFVLTLGIVWATAPLAVAAPAAHGLLNAFNPALVAILLTAALDGGSGVRGLLARLVAWRVPGRWYLAAVGLPLASAGLAVGLGALLGVPLGDPIGRMPPTLAILLVFIWIIGPGEELGWRGFALPRLLADQSPLVASLLLGAAWAGWHAPLFVTGIYANPWPHILWMVTSTVLFSLLYIGTRGSVLLAMVFHTSWNLAPELVLLPSFGGAELQQAITLFLIIGGAVSVLATVLAWPRLTSARPAEIVSPASAPSVV